MGITWWGINNKESVSVGKKGKKVLGGLGSYMGDWKEQKKTPKNQKNNKRKPETTTSQQNKNKKKKKSSS